MIILRLDNVSYTHPGGPGVQNLTWAIADDARLGFVGPNGAGKSTILNLLAGRLLPDRGFMVTAKGASVGYLPQEVRLDPQRSVLAEAMTASARLAAIEADLEQIARRLEEPSVYGDERALTRTLEQQQRLLAAYTEAGGLQYDNTVKATLRQLGFSDSDFEQPTSVLSGGQKKLLALTKLAVNRPACLLLDEPDNHLDLAGKAFLEKFIRGYAGAVVIVSHDRYLLDEVADNIVELEGGKLEFYIGNYTAYVVERELRRLR
ncbi:MAG: ATP-binding cassette domain-containing protein, partial [Anaerolineae bacterium]